MENKDKPLYSLLNQLLRDRDRRKLKPWFHYLKLFLTALFKLPASSAKIVWRGVKADLHSKYHRGQYYTWWAFSSCTLSLEVLQRPMYLGTTGTRTLFSIECLNAKNIKQHSYYKTEDEILLLPGFYFEVVSKVEAGNGLHIIHLREVIPPFTLLEPPFHIHPPPPPSTTSAITSSLDSIIDKVYEMNKDNDDMYKLFIVLPSPLYEWKCGNVFDNTYVIHFVCECFINQIHFASYPPYVVPNPRVFFGIYGEYMKEYMVPLAQHLYDHQMIDQFHDSVFWSTYKTNIDKIREVLDAVKDEVCSVRKASDTSELRDLLIPSGICRNFLCRSIIEDMSVRWVCVDHYPVDQLNLINELKNIENVVFDVYYGNLGFGGEVDASKLCDICDIVERGVRLYEIDLSSLKGFESCLERLKTVLSRGLMVSIYFGNYFGEKLPNDEKMRVERILRLCKEISASNVRVMRVNINLYSKYPEENTEMMVALKSIHKLHSLCITGQIVSQSLPMLKKQQLLTTLKLSDHPLSLDDVKRMATFIRSSDTLVNLTLSSVEMTNDKMEIVVGVICHNPIMKKLNVSNNKLSDESAPFIIHLVRTCSSLTKLDLGSNEITVFGACLLFEELGKNRTLLHFRIAFNDLSVDHARKTTKSNSSIVIVGEALAKVLEENSTLCTLDITKIKVSDNDIRLLKKGLRNNRTLAELCLGESTYSSSSCKQITDVLDWNCSLINLDLSLSELDTLEVQRLSDFLRNSCKLVSLDVGWCDIGDNGISVLCKALKKNVTLSHLSLRSNRLTSVGAEVLAKMLRLNKSITYLDISWNKVGDDGARAIAHVLLDNQSLTYLGILDNEITNIGGEAMVDALRSNYNLLHLNVIYGNKLANNTLKKLRFIRSNLDIS